MGQRTRLESDSILDAARDKPAPGEVAIDALAEKRRGKRQEKPDHPWVKIERQGIYATYLAPTSHMVPISILRDSATIWDSEILSDACKMQNAVWRILRAWNLHIPMFRQHATLQGKNRIHYVLIGIFRNAIALCEIHAALKRVRLAPALEVHEADAAAPITLRHEPVKRNFSLATPVHELKRLAFYPLNSLGIVPKHPQLADIPMPQCVHV